MRNKSVKTALEFSRLQSLFSAITMLASDGSNNEGDIINLLEIGEAYAGQLSQKYDDIAAAEKSTNGSNQA